MRRPRIASDKIRERWVATISLSFPELTLWRAVRSCYVDASELDTEFSIGLQKLSGILQELWLGPKVLSLWRRFHSVLRQQISILLRLMSWLEQRNWRDRSKRDEKHLAIKLFALSTHLVALLRKAYDGSLERLQNAYRYHGRVSANRQLTRRWSHDGRISYPCEALNNRYRYELALSNYAGKLAERYDLNVNRISVLYNTGQLFTELVSGILQQRHEEAEWYAMWNVPYKYPQIRLRWIEDADSEEVRGHWPCNGIPTLEDDAIVRDVVFI